MNRGRAYYFLYRFYVITLKLIRNRCLSDHILRVCKFKNDGQGSSKSLDYKLFNLYSTQNAQK